MKKILITLTSFLLLQATTAFANNPKAKDIQDVKTFDFERILKETEKYFEAANSWKVIKCSPKSGFVCTKRQCPKIENNNAYTIIDKKEKVISICRNSNCKRFKAEIRQAGVFHTIKVKDSDGVIVRILGNNRYKEITMLGLDAYISNGECEEYDEEKEKKMTEEKVESEPTPAKKIYRLKKGK